MPKVSVVIPAYNAMSYLPKTIDSLIAQTFTDFEAIIIDDGSSDNIKAWISQIADPRISLVSQKNQGAGAARNTGISNAKGEYIAFLDADDLWESTKLEKQVKILDDNPEVGVVSCWAAVIDRMGKPTGRIFKSYAEGNVWKALTEWNIIFCGSVPIVRRCCFENCGVFDLNLNSYLEDWDMWLRIANRYPFKIVKESLVYYRQLPNSGSRNWEAMAQNIPIVIEKAFASNSSNVLHLKQRSYGFANLALAWQPLQGSHKDYKKALDFLQQALKYYPSLRFSKMYIRVSIAITLMRLLKPNGYKKFIELFNSWRGSVLVTRR